MKYLLRRLTALLLAAVMSLTLTGCMFRSSVEDLFTLPRVSAEYEGLSQELDDLQKQGYELVGPSTGQNIQPVQMVDLDNDGLSEALVFMRLQDDEKPLKIFVFRPEDDTYHRLCVIESSGTAIDSVQYEDLTGNGRLEIIVGWRVSMDLQALAVYSLEPDGARELMRTNYVKYAVADLNKDGKRELTVLRANQDGEGVADCYVSKNGALTLRSSVLVSMTMAELSQQGRVKSGVLQDGTPALFVTGVEESAWMVTDILTVKNGELVNILLSDVTGVSSEIAPFSSLYPEDINGDGITEVPHPEPIPAWGNVGEDPCRRIDWYTYTSDGTKAAVVSTYHSVEDGWYLRLPDVWKDQILITRTAGTEEVTVTFSYRGDSGEPPQDVLRITKLTGSGREARATRGGRVILRRLPEIIYTAELLDANGSWEYGLTEDEVREAFSLITTEWSAGDS